MSFRNTAILVILLILLGGYALYVRHEPAPEKNPKVYKIKAQEIAKIDLRSPDRDLVLHRQGDEWRIVKPVEAASEHFAVNSLADQIAGVETTGTADENPTDLAPFGLAVPAVTVTVTTTKGKLLPSILVGKQTPIGNSVFIKTSDKPAVMLAASSFGAEVNKHVDDLRSRDLFALKPADVRKIVVRRSGAPELMLSRTGAKWTFDQPRHYPADNDAVGAFLRGLTDARVTQFIDDNPSDLSKYGLSTPSMTITLTGADGKPHAVAFGYREPQTSSDATYARSGEGASRPVYTVTNDIAAAANKSFDDLRDRMVLTFNRSDISRIDFSGGPNKLDLQRDPAGKWTITADGKTVPGEPPVITSLLDQLHELKATRIVEDAMSDPAHYGMVKPTVTLALYGKDGKKLDGLRASVLQVTTKPQNSDEKPSVKNFGYVVTDRDGTVYEVPAQTIADLENTGNRLQADVIATPTPTRSAPSASATH